MSARILIAGIGNIFLGDDGFGSEAARRLAQKPLPDGVTVVDYGIRGMHLAYDLLDGYEALVIIDAVPHQGAPGDLVVMEVTAEHLGHNAGELDAHGMEPTAVLASLGMLGGQLPVTYIVGCQPASLDENIGLTPSVAAAIEGAVAAVHALLNQQLSALLSPADGHLQVAAASRERNEQ